MMIPIAGNDLRVGDVLLAKVGQRMQVERITLRTCPDYPMRPMLIAHGPAEIRPDFTLTNWSESYYGDDWVVVEVAS